MTPVAIVITRNQNPESMVAALAPRMPIVISYDTPPKDEWAAAEKLAARFPSVGITRFDRSVPGFFAGANRNAGLNAARIFHPQATHYFFFDGDRVPDPFAYQYIDYLLRDYKADCCLFTCKEGDTRAIRRTDRIHGIVDTGCMVSAFYSCGFVLSRVACAKVMEANNGALFHPAFNGIWGEEDKFLGIQLDNLGFKTIFCASPRLGGKALTDAEQVPGYEISLQRRINLMQKYGYPLRPFDKYVRLVYENGAPASVYVGEIR